MRNKGSFEILKKEDKYVIVYICKGEQIDLSELEAKEFSFDSYDNAKTYLNGNKASLQELVDKVIALKQKKLEEQKAREKAEQEQKEAEWIEKGKAEEAKKAEQAKKKQERKEKRAKAFNKSRGFIAGFLVAAITLVGGHFIGAGIAKAVSKDKDDTEVSSNDLGLETSHNDDIDNIISQEEELTTENFTNLAAEFSKIYVDKNVNVTTEDLAKFVSIVNIDKLSEENPELAQELFSTQTKEEYLGDAAKIIGMTYTYNRNVFEAEQSTENFIRISDAVYGPQKEILQTVEGYVDQIALVRDNAEETNKLISELLQKLGDPTSELSYLDDGVGFGMQVCVELIRSYLAKDVINQENLDWLSELTSSEEYVSNIFTTYAGCGNSYTRTKTK